MSDNKAHFGTAGHSLSFTEVSKTTKDAPRWLAERGLDAYEYQCGNGVTVGEKTAAAIGAEAVKHDIRISLHSPYYISLANPAQLEKNIAYVLASCRAAQAMGASRVVVHTGSPVGRDREEAMKAAALALDECLRAMDENGFGGITLCPETMGKIGQLGTTEEVVGLCVRDERLRPCVDFGHLYARSLGKLEGYDATPPLFDYLENSLGTEHARSLHAHFSKIEYSAGGEKRHLTFDDPGFGPDFMPVARLVAERGYAPVFICESRGTQAEDAIKMRDIYLNELNKL